MHSAYQRYVPRRPQLKLRRAPRWRRRRFEVRQAMLIAEAELKFLTWRREELGGSHCGEVAGIPYHYHGDEAVRPLIEELVQAVRRHMTQQGQGDAHGPAR